MLEHDFLDEQVNAIKEIGDKISQLKRAGKGLGEYLFDQKLKIENNHTLKELSKKE